MNNNTDQIWPHIVALVGITLGALGTAFGVWTNANLSGTIASIEAQSKIEELEIRKKLELRENRCQQLSELTGKLAQNRAEYFHNTNLEKRAAMEGFIWEGASYLSQEEQREILKRFDEGQNPQDKYGINFVAELSSITLGSLAKSAAACRHELGQIKRNG
ncbi:hypothetical protein [Stutzerimonas nitrititolerans]|uniref:hypothetical protein n=1 Tax=Stutzerimonas nitrititolerans TaxID=2482751 RepID=UPI00289C80D1|nr:hypothetical protein [Stutzerimonas nitrititolerans]